MLDSWIDPPVYQWMTWQEVGAEAAAGSTIAVAIGATEQHGPHLPVCTDWVIPTEILRRAAQERHFVVGPPGRGPTASAVGQPRRGTDVPRGDFCPSLAGGHVL